jgi:hypothetical protein
MSKKLKVTTVSANVLGWECCCFSEAELDGTKMYAKTDDEAIALMVKMYPEKFGIEEVKFVEPNKIINLALEQ